MWGAQGKGWQERCRHPRACLLTTALPFPFRFPIPSSPPSTRRTLHVHWPLHVVGCGRGDRWCLGQEHWGQGLSLALLKFNSASSSHTQTLTKCRPEELSLAGEVTCGKQEELRHTGLCLRVSPAAGPLSLSLCLPGVCLPRRHMALPSCPSCRKQPDAPHWVEVHACPPTLWTGFCCDVCLLTR